MKKYFMFLIIVAYSCSSSVFSMDQAPTPHSTRKSSALTVPKKPSGANRKSPIKKHRPLAAEETTFITYYAQETDPNKQTTPEEIKIALDQNYALYRSIGQHLSKGKSSAIVAEEVKALEAEKLVLRTLQMHNVDLLRYSMRCSLLQQSFPSPIEANFQASTSTDPSKDYTLATFIEAQKLAIDKIAHVSKELREKKEDNRIRERIKRIDLKRRELIASRQPVKTLILEQPKLQKELDANKRHDDFIIAQRAEALVRQIDSSNRYNRYN